MTREDALEVFTTVKERSEHFKECGCRFPLWTITDRDEEAIDMAIEALSSDAIAKAYNQGFVEGSVNATVNSNYICPRCGEKMERKESGDTE